MLGKRISTAIGDGWLRTSFVTLLALFTGFDVLAADAKKAPTTVSSDHAAQMARGLDVFKKNVRAILVQKCVRCHGGKATESAFDLTTREGLLHGGEKGPDIQPGNAKASRLYQLVSHSRKPYMPHEAAKLPDSAIAQIAEWIDLGAPYDAPLIATDGKGAAWTRRTIDPDARTFWSYQPLHPGSIPPVKNSAWCRTPVDRFILAKLEKNSIVPNPEVDRTHLVRRLYFDLCGLPPTPEQVDAFLNDPRPGAYKRLVDQLLDSPHYGERWARHWLDLARFAESHGFEHDYDRPEAYHYRDFVIGALNSDMPYDTFVRWQLAGDELDPDNPLALMATGFLAAGVHSTQITKNEVERQRYDEMDDMLATTGTAMLGLTIGCARCHDHKYDPIPQADYYRMLSAFTTTVRSVIEIDRKTGTPIWPTGPKRAEGAPKKAPADPNRIRVLVASEGLPALRLHTQGEDFFPNTYFLRRGDTGQKNGIANPGYLQILMTNRDGADHWKTAPPLGWRTSYRRRALAAWMTDVDNGAGALLARVIVNRLWQHHFGRGIVATPSEFGLRGDPPSHPELLDWLASELIRNGWRLKPIQKLIVCSAAYRQSSRIDPAKEKLDPENRLVWRRPVHRLEAEVIRDTLLSISGTLEDRMFGPGTLDEASRRRSIYFTVKRSKLMPMMHVFDAPDALGGIGDRPTTTIAPQALLLMNNPQIRAHAHAFARRLAPSAVAQTEDAIVGAYRIALSRSPHADELADAKVFIAAQMESYGASRKADARELALADFCQVLMCLNEMVYVE